MILTSEQIRTLLDRLKWEPVYEDHGLVVAKKRGIGYSADPEIGAIEAALSIMLEVARRLRDARKLAAEAEAEINLGMARLHTFVAIAREEAK